MQRCSRHTQSHYTWRDAEDMREITVQMSCSYVCIERLALVCVCVCESSRASQHTKIACCCCYFPFSLHFLHLLAKSKQSESKIIVRSAQYCKELQTPTHVYRCVFSCNYNYFRFCRIVVGVEALKCFNFFRFHARHAVASRLLRCLIVKGFFCFIGIQEILPIKIFQPSWLLYQCQHVANEQLLDWWKAQSVV